jgi:hypothetical protein
MLKRNGQQHGRKSLVRPFVEKLATKKNHGISEIEEISALQVFNSSRFQEFNKDMVHQA